MLTRLLLILALAGVGTVSLGGSAEANCRSLQRQLMMFQASREMGQYHRVLGLMAAQGCGGGQGFGRTQPEARAVVRPERRAVVRPERRAVVKPERPAVVTRSAPATESQATRRRPTREPRLETEAEPRMSVAAGTFRTLCVRTCDGYYFPISFSTTRDHFATDQARCEQACPGAQAAIYYHRVSGEGPESMVSLEGMPYAQLPVAFSHRSALNPSCSCGRPTSLDAPVVARAGERAEEAGATVAARLPRPRGQRGEDPETLANRDGSFVPRLAATLLAGNGQEFPGGVRVVGPDESAQVPVSPVPNDLDTSLLWDSSPS